MLYCLRIPYRIPGEDHLILSLTECRVRRYKKYVDDSSVPVPKSTQYYRAKRAKMSASLLPSLIPEHQSAFGVGYDPLQEVENPEESSEQNPLEPSSGRCALRGSDSATDEFTVFDNMGPSSEGSQYCDDDDDDQDSITSSVSEVSMEDSDSSTDTETSDTADDTETDNSPEIVEKTFSAQQTACMAILALISRHCITTEAAKDIIDLVRILCPENETLQSLTYANVQQVCGNCELFVYDVCERCFCLFPTELQDQVMCSTPGCNG